MEMLWVLQHLRCCQRRKKWCHTSQLMCRNTHGSIISTLALDGHIHNICSGRWFSMVFLYQLVVLPLWQNVRLRTAWNILGRRWLEVTPSSDPSASRSKLDTPGWWDGIRAEVTTYPCFSHQNGLLVKLGLISAVGFWSWKMMEDDGRWWKHCVLFFHIWFQHLIFCIFLPSFVMACGSR